MLTSRSIASRSSVLKTPCTRVPNVVGGGLISGVRSKPHPLAAAAVETSTSSRTDERGFALKEDGTYDLSAPPPFTLQDIRSAIPEQCWKKGTLKSVFHLVKDVSIAAGLAAAAVAINAWWAWPIYWFAQGTMFWSLFVVGHDCGHQSFSNNRALNDLVGNITHASILVPYHGWRISHRTHHANHGHCENDESWYPVKKAELDTLDPLLSFARLTIPGALLAFPAYLWKRSPGKEGSHYDPSCNLYAPSEKNMILTSNAFMVGMLGVLAGLTYFLGLPAMLNLYFAPYIIGVMWLDIVTYLHHHGPSDEKEQMPWYRGEAWSYFRGGLSSIDRDFGIFNKIHHNIETHVLHHLFSQMPHYNLVEATNAVKPVMGPYYREPEKSKGWFPTHLIAPFIRSFKNDHYVEDTGDIVFYKRSEAVLAGLVGKWKATA